MFTKLLKKSWIWFILVGVVAYCFGIYAAGISIISQEHVQYGAWTWNYYKIDVLRYLQNLEYSLTDKSIINIVPTEPTLPIAPNWRDILSILKFLVNSMLIFVFNCIIYALNWVVLAPIKLLIYPINIIYSLLAIDTQASDYIDAVNTLYSFEIPLIPAI